MSTAWPPGASAPERGGFAITLARSQRFVLLAAAAVVTLSAWLWLGSAAREHAAMLLPHRHHHHDPASFLYQVLMWQAMSIAMMTPTALRWMLTLAKLTSGDGALSSWIKPVTAFAGGYFVIWLGYSVAGTVLQRILQQWGHLGMEGRLARPISGMVLIAAGLLQFAPFKEACLRHCRNPLTYFLARWHNGPAGGFRLGLAHGTYCVGCCWALMLTGFAMGLMNLVWMAILTTVICMEQLAHGGNRIVAGFAVVMVGWGTKLVFF